MTLRWLRLFLILLAAAAFVPCVATGQEQAPAASDLVATQRQVLQGLAAKTDDLERKIQQNAEDDAKLADLRLQLEDLSRRALESAVVFRPRVSEINARLEQLGAAPAEGEPAEPEIVSDERAKLTAEKAEINAVTAMAQSLSIRISGLIDKIVTTRSELFRNLLTKRYALTDAFRSRVAIDTKAEFSNLRTTVSSWLAFIMKFKFQAVVSATMLALGVAAMLTIGGRRLFGKLVERDPTVEEPSYLSRLSVAFWSTLLPTLSLGAFCVATFLFFDNYGVLRGDIGVFLRAFMLMFVVVFCVNRLTRAALSPDMPSWRLVPVEARPARWLIGLATAMAIVVVSNNFLSVVNEQMGAPLSVTIARSFLSAIVVGLILILMGLVRPFRTHEGVWRRWPAWLRYSAFGLGLFTIGAALLGYIGLAIFVSLQVVITGTLLVLAYIGFLSARAVGEEGGFGGTAVGRWLADRTGVEEATVDQLGLAASLAINLLIVVIIFPMILVMWGFQLGDVQSWAYKLATGVNIGSMTISVTGLLSGIVVFVVGYFLTRWFQSWLDGSVMARGRVDVGVRNSIRMAVGYAGVAIAGLAGISAAGIDLSNLALVAGALSLGIGFGLQNVVSNFVSGLILLAERPFKVGDWIVAGNVSGTVKKISVRATEVETFQRESMILPNSSLINDAVGNWTHRNKLGRIDIKVGVAYGCDARRAHEILLEIARGHPLVLKNPEPFVLFANFGPSAMEFEIRIFLADVLNQSGVQNDIRFAILDAFAHAGIEIPSTIRAVVPAAPAEPWPTDDDKTELVHAEHEAARIVTEQGATKRRRKSRKPDPN
ncbi:mechanosensitive ion channel domain-containing protein [Mesorhizobium sp. PUT5]|uniref:mechanosensitive ion channel domain-containing protein n=1 Tax=Mesorhizobium sp. PUT5 TaxID=3454629 RepID=UPI003FA4C32E